MKQVEKINKNNLYHKLKHIWNRDFSNIMPFNQYYKQVAGQISLYHSFSKVEKAIFMRSQSNMVEMTINELELSK